MMLRILVIKMIRFSNIKQHDNDNIIYVKNNNNNKMINIIITTRS